MGLCGKAEGISVPATLPRSRGTVAEGQSFPPFVASVSPLAAPISSLTLGWESFARSDLKSWKNKKKTPGGIKGARENNGYLSGEISFKKSRVKVQTTPPHTHFPPFSFSSALFFHPSGVS